jgi:hypothetical protein
MVLLSERPLTVTCAGLLSSLVLIVVFLVVRDRSKRKAASCVYISRGATVERPQLSTSGNIYKIIGNTVINSGVVQF